MKKLVIVESPTKSKTIEKYLGKDYKVVSSKGHIRDLVTRGKEGLGVDVDNDFEATYVINKDKKDTVKTLQQEAKKADEVYLATDPDREGEAISWHLAQELDLDIQDNNRIVFNEITKKAVQNALANPRQIDLNLVSSQETRRILDRIIGFKLSKLLKNKIRSKSAGRVQSVALKIIVEREKEIQAFKPQEYWSIVAKFKEQNIEFEATLEKYKNKKITIENQQQADEIVALLGKEIPISNIVEKQRKKESRLPFITSTLQQEAANKLNFNSKKTMRIAQKLYEGIQLANSTEGLITYMRSDSTRLSQDFVNTTFAYIQENFGKEYVGKYRTKKDNANTQDAHEAIRVTDIYKTPKAMSEFLGRDELKLYKLIYARTLASLMAPAKQDTIQITFEKNDYTLVANGISLAFDGYLKIYGEYETSKEMILPKLAIHDTLEAKDIIANQHFTQPPLRYNEARLIKELEENGIGRPSTYAFIMETIVSRGYVEYKAMSENSKAKVFVPTEQGILTDEKLTENFSSVINVDYTAKMEKELDDIAEGEKDRISSLRKFYDEFNPLVQKAYETMEKEPLEKVHEKCPLDGGELVYRFGRFGKFIACENYPSCKYSRALPGKEKKPAITIDDMLCPTCNKPLVIRTSRYKTQFIGCSGFPKCRYIMPKEEAAPILEKYQKHEQD